MADPKTPFWKKGIQGVFKTKNPISSTKPPARLGVVITPEKIVQGQTLEQWKQRYIKAGMHISEKDLKTTFTNSWKQEQGIHKRSTPKRQPVNYRTSGEKLVRTFKGKVLPKLTLAAKAIKIGKSLTPWGLGGTALWYVASKVYDPERVKKSKTQWDIK